MNKSPGQNLAVLREILTKRLNEAELRDLCFDLKVDYDSLPGAGTTNKARELIAYFERRQNVSQLIETVRRQRPDISWDDEFMQLFTKLTGSSSEVGVKPTWVKFRDVLSSPSKLALILIGSIAFIGIIAWLLSSYFHKTSDHNPTNYSSKYSESMFAQKYNESALRSDELIEILNMRASKINHDLSQYYRYANIKEYLDEFNRLHKLHIEALKNGNIVLAHEILVDIHKLSFELAGDEFWTRHEIETPNVAYSLCLDAFQRGELVYGYICGDMKGCNYPSDKGIYLSLSTAEFEEQYSISFITSVYESILNGSTDSLPVNPLFVSKPSLSSRLCNKSR